MKISGKLFDSFFLKYSKLGKRPNIGTIIIWRIRQLLSSRWRKSTNLRRFLTAHSQPTSSLFVSEKLPSIEILFVSKSEDLPILKVSILSACANSHNPVSLVSIIVPDNEVEKTREYLIDISAFQKMEVISEDEVVSDGVRDLIFKSRKDRYGWILQQVLVSNYILNSKSEGVLVVDSDTILLRKKCWLTTDSRQILMPTEEMHLPYYNFLRYSSSRFSEPKNSFVSHHMLIQPHILRDIFKIWSGDISIALESAFQFSDPKDWSPFDLKYEIYAQFLVENHPGLVAFEKWGNISLPRQNFFQYISSTDLQQKLESDYNSISFHSWNT